MKRIYLDLETTRIDKFNCKILEIAVLFTEDFKVIDKLVVKVKIKESWDDLLISDIKGLKFNKILNKIDLEKHNQNALDLEEVMKLFLKKTKQFTDKKLPISGWNNAYFDLVVLERIFQSFDLNIQDYFDYHSRDIMCMFMIFKENKFTSLKSISLHVIHKYLFNTIDENKFHNAEYDCIATMDVDKWIKEEMEKWK